MIPLFLLAGFFVVIIVWLFVFILFQDDPPKEVNEYPSMISYHNQIMSDPYLRDMLYSRRLSMYDECWKCGQRGFHLCPGKKEEKKMIQTIGIKDLIENRACHDGLLWFMEKFGTEVPADVDTVKKTAIMDSHSSYADWLEQRFPKRDYLAVGVTYRHGPYNSHWKFGALVIAKDNIQTPKGYIEKGTLGIFVKFIPDTEKLGGFARVDFIGKSKPNHRIPFTADVKVEVPSHQIDIVYVGGETYTRISQGWIDQA